MSSSRIPFTVRDKNTKINAIPGMNFDDIKINTLIKKVDATNAGNSNIDSEYTATGSVTSIINGDPDGALAVVGGKITTEVTGGAKKMTLSVGDDALERGIIITENDTVSIIYDLTVTNVNIDGVINLNGTPGVAGAVLTSNGAADPTWETGGLAPSPYYIEIEIGNSGGSTVFVTSSNNTQTLNTLTTITTPISYYNADLIDTSTWSPSVAGLYSITFKAILRSINQDRLVEGNIFVNKEVGGVYTVYNRSNVRNYGASTSETDARVFAMTLPLTTTVYANVGDKFQFSFMGQSSGANVIWLLTAESYSNITITKLI